jgi:hypothetical protein
VIYAFNYIALDRVNVSQIAIVSRLSRCERKPLRLQICEVNNNIIFESEVRITQILILAVKHFSLKLRSRCRTSKNLGNVPIGLSTKPHFDGPWKEGPRVLVVFA